jgi:hypothetical protein
MKEFLCHRDVCEPMWMLVVPLFHMLRGDHTYSGDDYSTNSAWWGTGAGITDVLKNFHTYGKLLSRYDICILLDS